jgi:quinol monooxygenase YgiN
MPAHRTAAAVLALAAVTLTTAQANAQMKIEATSPNGETTLVVDFEVKPGSEAEFEKAFRLSARCSRLEPGNVVFNFHKVRDQSGRYVLYEIWRSPEALKSHFERPYTKALFKMFETALVKPVTEGGLRFIGEIEPDKRAAPVAGDPSTVAECK